MAKKLSNLKQLAKQVSYPIEDLALLELALTHKSVGINNNERLEFLGDTILNFIISTELYTNFPKATEGELTRARAKLVCEDALVKIAQAKNLSDYLIMGPGENKTGGHQRRSVLADSVEAIIGAIYCTSGLTETNNIVLTWFKECIIEIKNLDLNLINKDPKTILQELLQEKNLPLPEYTIIKITGEQHNQQFYISCKVSLIKEPAIGVGSSRRKAEQQAAEAVLQQIKL